MYINDNGAVLPTPTTVFGTKFIETTSPFRKLWESVFAIAIFVVILDTILSISPVTCSKVDSKRYS